MDNYVVYHLHSDLSNSFTTLDSVTKYKMYIDRAKELDMKAIAFSEHGNIMEWLHKKEYAEKNGLKYIHASEVYVTKSLDEKVRDNYHCVLICKNYEGVKELNNLLSHKIACNRQDNHFYYQPRITYDELKSTSDNIIIATACLGSILNSKDEWIKNDFIEFLTKNKHRSFLEIQHHKVLDQINYNKELYDISKKTGIPLIAGTDTHSLNELYSKGRVVLQKAKNIHFENEEGWDLTFKSYEELIECYKNQNSLPEHIYIEAIDNTNKIANMIEGFEVDRSHKYPEIYKNPNEVFKQKIKQGIKDKNIKINNDIKSRIIKEVKAYKNTGAINYLLLEEDIKSYARDKEIYYGYSRGSVSGSYIAYLLNITDVDSIKFDLSFERFINPERVSLADIDTDYPPSQRDIIKEYIYKKEGLHCADIITFNTIATKGAIRDVGRAFNISLDEVGSICKQIDIDEDTVREKYKDIFEYVDLLSGVIVSVGIHPCALVVSPYPIEDIGTFTTSNNKYPITQLNMKEIDSMNYVKLDLLGLDNIEIINETCKLVGIDRLNPDNLDTEDERVWDSIIDSGLGVFQWESDMAHSYYKDLFSKETIKNIKASNPNIKYIDLFSVGNGAIRPAGASYRSELASGVFRDNGHEALNNLLSSTMGFLVYQEQVLEFLNKFCGYSKSKADIIRRGFAKKTGTEQYIPEIKSGFIKTMRENYNVLEKESEIIITDFLKVIEDASSYLFSLNHSLPYSMIGYANAWLRYYYPLEFLTVMLNINEDKQDKTIKVMDYVRDYTNIKIKSIKFRYSKAEYNMDKENNYIYKGMASIKHLNKNISEELYELRVNNYNAFTELLMDIKDKTSVNSRQLDILIKLNYFQEFGNINKLLRINDLYNNCQIKQIKKDAQDKLNDLGITVDELKQFGNETEKMINKIDSVALLHFLSDKIPDEEDKTHDILTYENDILGNLTHIDSSYRKDIFHVCEIETGRAITNIKLYRIKDGSYIKLKMWTNSFVRMELNVNETIKLTKSDIKKKNKVRATGEINEQTGKKIYEPIDGEYEYWLNKFIRVKN